MTEDLTTIGEDGLSYNRYLQINTLLELQKLESNPAEHDEMLFIITHQAYELWFRQIHHDIGLAKSLIADRHYLRLIHLLKRTATIFHSLIGLVDVLETMPADDFNRFRNFLNPASGFQSGQFKILEYTLGLKNPGYLKYFVNEPEWHQRLKDALHEPSVWDLCLTAFAETFPAITPALRQADYGRPYEPQQPVLEALTEVYQQPNTYSSIYMVLEGLMDIDAKLKMWRYRHVLMVERMIGFQMGTGGSKGVDYLRSTLTKTCFPEIWQVRNQLGV